MIHGSGYLCMQWTLEIVALTVISDGLSVVLVRAEPHKGYVTERAVSYTHLTLPTIYSV